jgi:hypothetical protein
LDDLSFNSIGGAEAIWLERVFEEGEVLKVVKATNGDKVWGPDGYSVAFLQVCQVVLKEDNMMVFCDFHARSKFEKSLNSKFIVLISKVPGAADPKDFRPISLVTTKKKLFVLIF